MANKKAPKKITDATSKIASIVDFMLNQDQHDLKVHEIHLTSKNGGGGGKKIVCKNVLVNGKWELQCTKE